MTLVLLIVACIIIMILLLCLFDKKSSYHLAEITYMESIILEGNTYYYIHVLTCDGERREQSSFKVEVTFSVYRQLEKGNKVTVRL